MMTRNQILCIVILTILVGTSNGSTSPPSTVNAAGHNMLIRSEGMGLSWSLNPVWLTLT